MRFWLFVLLILIVLFAVFSPPVNKERLCYEASKVSLNTITTDILARGIPISIQCERRGDILYTLEMCIRDATKSSILGIRANTIVQRIVATVRLSGSNLWTMKTEHNEECEEFRNDMLP